MAFALLSLSSLSFWISIDQWLLCCHRGAMTMCALAFALLSLWLSVTFYFHSYWYLSAVIDHWHLKCCHRGAMTRRAMAFACRWIAFLPPDKPLWPQVTNHIQYHLHAQVPQMHNTTGQQPHTIPRAHIPQMHNTTCTKYLLSHQPHMWNRVNASQNSLYQPSLVKTLCSKIWSNSNCHTTANKS